MSSSSWVPIPEGSDFSIDNLPYGIFSTADNPVRRVGIAVGESILDIRALVEHGHLADLDFDVTTLQSSVLNPYAALGPNIHARFRMRIRQLLEKDGPFSDELQNRPERRAKFLVDMATAQMHKPMDIGDYTDVLAGFHHTQNCAQIIQSGSTAEGFAPRFFDAPVAYNGRASSIVVSGTSFARPKGPILSDGRVLCKPTETLDFEVEFAVLIGLASSRDKGIDVDQAARHIFGFVLMNDWSTRDIQFTESRPLGPFNGKQTCTTISPWVVPLAALEPFLTTLDQSRSLMPYLAHSSKQTVFDIPIKATLEITDRSRYHIATCNTKNLIWSFDQMLAHHTVSGCPLETGDLIATGTLSGATQGELGCLFELTDGGKRPCELQSDISGGKALSRLYLEDGDTVEYSAQLSHPNGTSRIGFGVCRGSITPALGTVK